MRILALVAGVICLIVVLLDAFQTIILPRRATGRFRPTRIFYLVTWKPWAFVTRRLHKARIRETALSFYGPLSLIFLLVAWASVMVLGFGLLYFGLGSPFLDATKQSGFRSDLYVSGTTIFTLGLGDVTPQNSWARALVILEAGIGLGFLAVVMGYFPVLYSAFSRPKPRSSAACAWVTVPVKQCSTPARPPLAQCSRIRRKTSSQAFSLLSDGRQ